MTIVIITYGDMEKRKTLTFFSKLFSIFVLFLEKVLNEESLIHLIRKAQSKDQKAQTQLINMFWVDVFLL